MKALAAILTVILLVMASLASAAPLRERHNGTALMDISKGNRYCWLAVYMDVESRGTSMDRILIVGHPVLGCFDLVLVKSFMGTRVEGGWDLAGTDSDGCVVEGFLDAPTTLRGSDLYVRFIGCPEYGTLVGRLLLVPTQTAPYGVEAEAHIHHLEEKLDDWL